MDGSLVRLTAGRQEAFPQIECSTQVPENQASWERKVTETELGTEHQVTEAPQSWKRADTSASSVRLGSGSGKPRRWVQPALLIADLRLWMEVSDFILSFEPSD